MVFIKDQGTDIALDNPVLMKILARTIEGIRGSSKSTDAAELPRPRDDSSTTTSKVAALYDNARSTLGLAPGAGLRLTDGNLLVRACI